MIYQSSSALGGQSGSGVMYVNGRGPITAFSSAPHTIDQNPEVQDTSASSSLYGIGLDAIQVAARIIGKVSKDSSVHAGRLLSADLLDREKARGLISTSLKRFATESYEGLRITSETQTAAQGFISAIGETFDLPKVAPDGEGGLMLVWEAASVALVVDGWRLHLVVDAGTPHARYFDDLPFDGKNLPDEVLKVVPHF
jgi:hypothetical protein